MSVMLRLANSDLVSSIEAIVIVMLVVLIAVFVSPETVSQSAEWHTLVSDPVVKRKISMVAVDEAHCISEWLIKPYCATL